MQLCRKMQDFCVLWAQMRILLQRVRNASVTVGGEITGSIHHGLLLLVGVGHTDTDDDIRWLVQKVLNLRIFNDNEDKMNLSVTDVQGDLLVVSQFTLYADTKKGNRPSYTRSAPPPVAIPLYEAFLRHLRASFGGRVETGIFGADMKVELLNDGPVTIWLDSKDKG
jgi:D-tyrosyl-tRNA(Tyr) deacylase